MKKLFLLPALLLAALAASAEVLSPSAALTRAAEQLPASVSPARKAAARSLANAEPLITIAQAAEAPELYVFASTASGMVVASADSETSPLLGYSENYVEGGELPETMLCMLNLYAEEIRALRAGDVIAAKTTPSSRADFSPITPICKTTWNQDAPYNDNAPLMNGKRTYTGCVATAMAQVLKTFEYPENCSGGTYSYTWENGGKKLSMNFNTTTLNWSNMLDSYKGSTTSAQRTAVSGLMKAIGYASDMNYGTEGSGTQSIYCVAGLIRNFDYDYSMRLMRREWFALADWQKMVYDELAAGRPVYYDGQNTAEKVGHAFVVDGYRSDGFFHLNWGWGGALDGYFLLTALDPDGQQGIGGSGGGYSDGCSALFGMKPGRTTTVDEAPLTFCILGSGMVLPSQVTTKGQGTISFGAGGFICNYSPFEVSGAYMALKFTSSVGQVYYSQFVGPIDNLQPLYGYTEFPFALAGNLPEGSYTVQLCVTRETGDEVYDVYADVSTPWRKTAVVSGSKVTFSDYVEPAKGVISLISENLPSKLTVGSEFTASVTLANTTADLYKGTVELNLYKTGTTTKVATLATQTANVAAGKATEVSVTSTLADGTVAPGSYTIGFALADGVAVSPTRTVTVSSPEAKIAGEIVCTNNKLDELTFVVKMTALNAAYKGPVLMLISKNASATTTAWSRTTDVEIAEGETLTMTVTDPDFAKVLKEDTKYYFFGGYQASGSYVYFEGTPQLQFTTASSSAIDEVDAAEANAEYYDLGGRRVLNPKSGLYIRRQGSNTQTVLIR